MYDGLLAHVQEHEVQQLIYDYEDLGHEYLYGDLLPPGTRSEMGEQPPTPGTYADLHDYGHIEAERIVSFDNGTFDAQQKDRTGVYRFFDTDPARLDPENLRKEADWASETT